MKNNRNFFLSLILGIVILLGSMDIAQAQPVPPGGLSQAVTSFYNNKEAQLTKVEILKKSGYSIATPLDLPIPCSPLPEGSSIPAPGSLGDGSFQQAVLDFQQVVPLIPGTAQYFSFTAPLGTDKLYSVVAGKPDVTSCPLQIDDTQVAFFTTEKEAIEKAEKLMAEDYLVYVSPDKEAQIAAVEALLKLGCCSINGLTKKATVNFEDIYYLLPNDLQQPARQQPFIYSPEGDFIYLVNARKTYDPADF